MLEPTKDSEPMNSVKSLLSGSIDYAGLFPPAKLSMDEAVINYATYRTSNYNWLLGRFVVTDSRLAEFYEHAGDFISRDNKQPWQVSVVGGEDVDETFRIIDDFNSANAPAIIVDTVEVRARSAEMIESTARVLPDGVAAYYEVPLDAGMPDLIATLSLTGQRAKIRTGGVTPDTFPAAADVIRFVRTCLAANILFKATAGLHHPIRCFKPLTYESNSLEGTMHGFLNLFLMTGFAREGYRPTLLNELMEEEFEEVFRFDDQAVTWRDDFSLNLWQIERLRSHGIQSFGSCSFEEPVADLRKLGVL